MKSAIFVNSLFREPNNYSVIKLHIKESNVLLPIDHLTKWTTNVWKSSNLVKNPELTLNHPFLRRWHFLGGGVKNCENLPMSSMPFH